MDDEEFVGANTIETPTVKVEQVVKENKVKENNNKANKKPSEEKFVMDEEEFEGIEKTPTNDAAKEKTKPTTQNPPVECKKKKLFLNFFFFF